MNEFSEQKLDEALTALPKTRSPRTDLWPGIESRLGESGGALGSERSLVMRRFSIAAMLVVAAMVSYQVGLQRGTDITEQNFLAIARAYQLDALSSEYVSTIREAAAMTAQQTETQMQQEAIDAVRNDMNSIIQTEAMLREAIKADPENEFLARMLVRLQARQLQLIQEIPQIERQIWRTI